MTNQIRNCQFKFECPKIWDDLAETADERVRHCGECNRMVIFCRTAKQLKRAIVDNYCVAIEVRDSDGEVTQLLGDPVPPEEFEDQYTERGESPSNGPRVSD